MMSKLPNKIKQYIENQIPILDSIGESQSKVYLFENMVLKISKNQIESKREYQALKILKRTLPVPKVIAYVETKKYVYLLMEKVNGKPLFQYPLDIAIREACLGLTMLWDSQLDDQCFSHKEEAMQVIMKHVSTHDSTDLDLDEGVKREFQTPKILLAYLIEHYPNDAEKVLSHGDYYLPNVLYDGQKITAMIDFGYLGLFPKERDVSALIKSLGYNYGDNPDYLKMIEKALGMQFDPKLIRYFSLYDELI